MSKYLTICVMFLVQLMLSGNGQAQLSILEAGKMQDMTGAAGICVPAVPDACADKLQKEDALISDSDRIKEVGTTLNEMTTPVRPDPNVNVLQKHTETVVVEALPVSVPITLDCTSLSAVPSAGFSEPLIIEQVTPSVSTPTPVFNWAHP